MPPSDIAFPGAFRESFPAAVRGRRRSVSAAFQQSLTLAWRSLTRLRTVPEETAGFILQPVIYVVLFVFVMGEAISGSWQAHRDFALPGIAVQMVVLASLGTGLSLNTDLEKGLFDRFRTLPISRFAPLFGAVLGDLVRYALSLAVMAGFGAAIGFRPAGGSAGTALACVLILSFAFALCWIWTLLGLTARTASGVQTLATVILFPLAFGSSTLVSTDGMPGWIRVWAEVNPVTWVTDGARSLVAGDPQWHPIAGALVWSTAILAIFLPLTVRAYRCRVR
ncbi:ABC transporter permease [Streptomyces sp. A3M-1-3]|uniref:ABC transporter permease n=1 Tax=Streptomyces sp. A3M-1-3 TaxID=2962044 RepID=UPI0020B771A7|nr:ABC transporter permease [Streptomyces sp. A3M-1-3]MCP3821620.1 ABC transporter permease [Streptomyces sp. A3M-1-3]